MFALGNPGRGGKTLVFALVLWEMTEKREKREGAETGENKRVREGAVLCSVLFVIMCIYVIMSGGLSKCRRHTVLNPPFASFQAAAKGAGQNTDVLASFFNSLLAKNPTHKDRKDATAALEK